jgi:transposase
MSLKRIAATIGVERKTVRRWLRAGGIPSWRQPRRGGILRCYAGHLNRRWNEGCRNAAQLWRELVAPGFTGCRGTVRHWTRQQRKAEPRPDGVPAALAETHQPPTTRQIARLLMTDDVLPSLSRAWYPAC